MLAGFLLGWSIVIEFTAGPSAALIALYRLIQKRQDLMPTTAALAIGGLVAILPLLAYNRLAFGSPLALGYAHVVGFAGMQEGLFGIRMPSILVVWEILFGQHRGLTWTAPILLLVPVALWRLFAEPRRRVLAVLLTSIAVYYVLLNASYFYWDGGASTGPRHLTPILPFVCLPLCMLWQTVNRWLLVGLLGLSIAASLVCAAVTMTAEPIFERPVWDFLLPEFVAGNLKGLMVQRARLLQGHLGLLPLFLMWGVFGVLGWRLALNARRRGTRIR
jgi:hypothetical protein